MGLGSIQCDFLDFPEGLWCWLCFWVADVNYSDGLWVWAGDALIANIPLSPQMSPKLFIPAT